MPARGYPHSTAAGFPHISRALATLMESAIQFQVSPLLIPLARLSAFSMAPRTRLKPIDVGKPTMLLYAWRLMMDLIAQLRARQKDQGMTQAEFAAVLGISEAFLSLIFSGDRQVGEATGRRIIRAYPDLQWAVVAYIMEKAEVAR